MQPPTRSALLFLATSLAAGLLGACTSSVRIAEEKRALVVGSDVIATIDEVVRVRAAGGFQVQRIWHLDGAPDAMLTLARLDAEGFVVAASNRREGPKGKRYVELITSEGAPFIISRGDGETLELPRKPIVLVELMHLLRTTTPRDVTLLDLENATAVDAKVTVHGAVSDEHGQPFAVAAREMSISEAARLPGAAPSTPPATPPTTAPTKSSGTVPLPADPVLAAHTLRAPFLEATTPTVVSFAKGHATGLQPVEAAHALADAIRPRLAADRAGGPATALNTLAVGGGDDAGACLLVASLRALGHPARVISGVSDGALAVWADVHDGTQWVPAAPLAPGARALAEGLPGPLTTGTSGIAVGR